MSGLNFQNLKRGGTIRRSIIAPEGYVFVVSDLSQIELRFTLWLGGEHETVQRLANGADVYSELATELYGVEVTKKKAKEDRQYEEMRHVGKETTLGCGFMMGAAKFQIYVGGKGIKVTPEFAKQAVKLYRSKYPGVVRAWDKIETGYFELLELLNSAAAQGLASSECDLGEIPVNFGGHEVVFGFDPMFGSPGIKLPSGLWLKYPGLKLEERQWSFGLDGEPTKIHKGLFYENLIQALARCGYTDKALEVNARYPVVLSTHDELVALVPEDEEDEGTAFVHEVMTAPISWISDLPIGAETKAGKIYGDIK